MLQYDKSNRQKNTHYDDKWNVIHPSTHTHTHIHYIWKAPYKLSIRAITSTIRSMNRFDVFFKTMHRKSIMRMLYACFYLFPANKQNEISWSSFAAGVAFNPNASDILCGWTITKKMLVKTTIRIINYARSHVCHVVSFHTLRFIGGCFFYITSIICLFILNRVREMEKRKHCTTKSEAQNILRCVRLPE